MTGITVAQLSPALEPLLQWGLGVARALAGVDYATVVPTAARRVARIAVLIGVGVFLANLAVEYGAVERIAGVSRYLTGPANLPDEVGTAILTTAASTTAGYGMLADFRESGRLSDRATLVAVTINTFFGFTQHVFTFYVPVLIPILGPDVGVLYVGTRGGIALGISLVGVLAGAVLLSDGDVDESVTVETESDSGPETDPETAPDGGTDRTGGSDDDATDGTEETAETNDSRDDVAPTEETESGAVAAAWASTASKLRRIVPRLAAVYLLVTVLAAAELFRSLSAAAGPLAEVTGLPAAAVPVIVVFAFDTTAGAATVAPLIGDALTVDQAVVTMLLGGIVTFAVSTFKRSIPFQYGIWGASFGSKVIVVNTVLKIVFISAAVVVFLV